MTSNFEELYSYVDGHPLEELLRNAFHDRLIQYGITPKGDAISELAQEFDLYEFAQFLPDSKYFINAITDIKNHLEQYRYVYDKLLSDELSKATFSHLLHARLFLSAAEAGAAYMHYQSQYFQEDLFTFQSGEVMMDCGGYTGDTTLEFIQKHPDFHKIHLFEASHDVMQRTKANLGAFVKAGDVVLHENAVGCINRLVSFHEGKQRGDGQVNLSGKNRVSELAIDDITDEPVTIIKMDIEGYERNALTGAAKIICKDTPKMMISLYHLADDLWQLPMLIESINGHYKFYVRHLRKFQFYSTVLYCVPTNSSPALTKTADEATIQRRLRELDRFCVVPTEEDEGVNFNGYYEYLLNLTQKCSRTEQKLEQAAAQRESAVAEAEQKATKRQKAAIAEVEQKATERQKAAIAEVEQKATKRQKAAIAEAEQKATKRQKAAIAEVEQKATERQKAAIAEAEQKAAERQKAAIAEVEQKAAERQKKAAALVKDAQEEAARAVSRYAQLQMNFNQSAEKIISTAESSSQQIERGKVRWLLRLAGIGSAFLHAGIGGKFNILGKSIARLFDKNIKMNYADSSPYYILRDCLNLIHSQALQMQNAGTEPAQMDPVADVVPYVHTCSTEPDDAVVDQLVCIPNAVEKPRKKRIAYFTNQVVDWQDGRPRFGGGERYLVNLSNLLKEYGYAIDVYQPAFYEGKAEYYGLPVRLMKAGKCYSEFSLENADQFYEISLGYDHVIYNLPEYSAGKMRKDALMMCHGIWFDHNNYGSNIKFRQPKWMGLLQRAFNNPLKIVSVDTNSVNVIRSFFPELSAKMTFIPNFVDTSCFKPSKEPRRNEKLKIIFPRRSQVNRGSRILGDILAQIPYDVEFYWVGEGDAEDTEIIKNLVKKDSRLHYRNATFEEMPSCYQMADIAVIPTLACEGTSLSCIEAMACGCATVATNVGGLPDIIFNEINGLCVDPTADALAQAINRLITDRQLRGHLQQAGYEQAQRLSLTNWKDKWRAVLRQMKWIEKDDRKNPRVCIVTRNAIHGGVESLIRMEKESLRADVIVAGGLNDPYKTCPFRFLYIATYKALLATLLKYDVVIYHWIPDWAVQAIAVSGVFSMEFVHRVDTAESSKTVPNLILSHSQYILDYITKKTGRSEGMYVIPNGADLTRFAPTGHGNKKKIGALTSYYDTKGIDILIRAWQMMKPKIRGKYTLTLYGAGTDLEKYRRMIRPDDQIELNPSTDEPEKVYGELFLYVTAARIEGLPVSILEAMACNLPVIASNIDGHRVINEIAEKHGFQAPLELVPPENPKAFAKAIEEYIQNPRIVNTREITEKIFSGEAHCEGLQKLINAFYIHGDAPEAENACKN